MIRVTLVFFLGISDETKEGYRLFNPITKKIVISMDVVFEEEKSDDGIIVMKMRFW